VLERDAVQIHRQSERVRGLGLARADRRELRRVRKAFGPEQVVHELRGARTAREQFVGHELVRAAELGRLEQRQDLAPDQIVAEVVAALLPETSGGQHQTLAHQRGERLLDRAGIQGRQPLESRQAGHAVDRGEQRQQPAFARAACGIALEQPVDRLDRRAAFRLRHDPSRDDREQAPAVAADRDLARHGLGDRVPGIARRAASLP